MKILFLVCSLCLSQSLFAFASVPSELVCATDSDSSKSGGVALSMSCVSKASIEREKLEIKKLTMEIEAMEAAKIKKPEPIKKKRLAHSRKVIH